MGGLLTPENTRFVLLAFEGPDPYASAGGLGVRVRELSGALAEAGFRVDQFFVGDPVAPGVESAFDGRLTLHRWCQWISAYYPAGVYDGENDKVRDFCASAPGFVLDEIIAPAMAEGQVVVVLGEEWHVAGAMCGLHELLVAAGWRERCVLLWNANNAFGFDWIDWVELSRSSTITTVSRYMKQLMWDYGVNPLVVPNGIPRRLLRPVDGGPAAELRRALGADTLLLKVARWDPDKRWISAVETVARLRERGNHPVLVARGGIEAHGQEVMERTVELGLRVRDVWSPPGADAAGVVAGLQDGRDADIVNVRSPMPEEALRMLYHESDAVLANSGREPFGLVGLETMAAGGTVFTGHTGEDYARHLDNAVVLETSDPDEAAWYVEYMAEHPAAEEAIRRVARETAAGFVWDRVTANLLGKVELLAAQQGAVLGWSRPDLSGGNDSGSDRGFGAA